MQKMIKPESLNHLKLINYTKHEKIDLTSIKSKKIVFLALNSTFLSDL